jgi:tRNA threonylcarbamoyl adenosine modification protein YeaZ
MSEHPSPTPSERAHQRFILAIELSNPSASPKAHAVAIFDADESDALVGSMAIPAGVRSSDALMGVIETLCAEHHCTPRDIERVVVSVGPGGYTALRISTTTAKVLAETLGCTLVAVPSARVGACSIKPEHRPALIALASKNERAHCSIVNADGSIESVGVIDASAIDSYTLNSIVGDGHLPRSFIERGEKYGIQIKAIELDARRCLEAAEGLEPVSPDALRPIYAREPDALTQWRARTHD